MRKLAALACVLSTAVGCEDGHVGTSGSGGASSGAGGATGTGTAPLACGDVQPVTALSFDGVDDHVTMGEAPALGLSQFTIEAWIRRDGYGVPAGSGSIWVVPIAGHGSCKNDTAEPDCNYTLALKGDVLFADLEDNVDGTNHPVSGKTIVTWGVWHHVAATYDGTWRLYVDGALDVESTRDAEPRADTIQHFAIGTAFNAANEAEGRFEGSIAEVRVWDRARTGEEIVETMHLPVTDAEGLVGQWSLDQAAGTDDATGTTNGTIEGATVDDNGPSIGAGTAPSLSVSAPSDMVMGSTADLSVQVSDPESTEPVEVTFYVREVTEADEFTVVVLPDTQYYTDVSRNTVHFFNDQVNWIMGERENRNIVAVIHNGDIVEHGNRDEGAWVRADNAMSTIEPAQDGLPDGIPYTMAVGNHDTADINVPDGTQSYNEWFGLSRFRSREYWGGNYGGDADEHWITFNVGGLTLFVVTMQYRPAENADVTAWMRSIFDANPNAFGILNSHYILKGDNTWGVQGKAMFEALATAPSLRLMTCGHVCVDGDGESKRSDPVGDRLVHSMLGDYQCFGYSPPPGGGGQGYLRIWTFSPMKGELRVETYSPSLEEFRTGRDATYTLPVDLRGAGKPFTVLSTSPAESGTATAAFTALDPGRTYEWYATARDCTHATTTPISRFTTPAL